MKRLTCLILTAMLLLTSAAYADIVTDLVPMVAPEGEAYMFTVTGDGALHVRGTGSDGGGDAYANSLHILGRDVSDFTLEFAYTPSRVAWQQDRISFRCQGDENEWNQYMILIRGSELGDGQRGVALVKGEAINDAFAYANIALNEGTQYYGKLVVEGHDLTLYFGEDASFAGGPLLQTTLPSEVTAAGREYRDDYLESGDFQIISWGGDFLLNYLRLIEAEEGEARYLTNRLLNSTAWDMESDEGLTATIEVCTAQGAREKLRASYVKKVELNRVKASAEDYEIVLNDDGTLSVVLAPEFIRANSAEGKNTITIYWWENMSRLNLDFYAYAQGQEGGTNMIPMVQSEGEAYMFSVNADGGLHVLGKQKDYSGDAYANSRHILQRNVGDFVLEFEYTPSAAEWNQDRISFRCQEDENEWNQYMILFRGSGLGEGQRGVALVKGEDFAHAYAYQDMLLEAGAKYYCRLEAKDHHLKLYFDKDASFPNGALLEAELPDDTSENAEYADRYLAEGDFQIVSWGGDFVLDSFRVTQIGE